MLGARESKPLLHRSYLASQKRQQPWYIDKTFYLNLIRRSLAEFLGTGLFVFTAVSALSGGSKSGEESGGDGGAVSAGISQGLAYGALVAAMMHVR